MDRRRPHEEREEGIKKRKEREGEEEAAAGGDNDGARVNSERERKRERRLLGKKVKKEEEERDEGVADVAGPDIEVRVKVKNEEANDFAIGGNGAAVRPFAKRLRDSPDASSLPPPRPRRDPSKVSSISNTNENTGVSGTRSSHEVPGNSSTDWTSSSSSLAPGKSGILSLDALAKAKKDLQMQKLKKLTKSAAVAIPGIVSLSKYEAVKRAQELAAKMGFRQDPLLAPLINMFPGQMPHEISAPQKPNKAPVLRVDTLGRELDEHGNVVSGTRPSNLCTLKVNINKQKKEEFQILKQAKDMKARQSLHAKARSAPDNPNLIEVSERVLTKEKTKDPIPEIEWWDVPLLPGDYDSVDQLRVAKITIYVEHPRPVKPPAEPAPSPPQTMKLTKKEQKKLRTQRRLAREKDKQEMIRQGLIEPPKPKVKMNNLMKVLGSEATQDPTRLEMEISSAAAEREQAHIDRNLARKRTPAERRQKKQRKLFDDPNTLETIVSVYKIDKLLDKKTRFKVDVNAQENRLTGCCVLSEGVAVVVVEGGSKSITRYGKLMLKRINWTDATNDEDGDDFKGNSKNKCSLVWQGSVAKPCFRKFSFHECMTVAGARKIFSDAGVSHYWDQVNFSEETIFGT